MSRSNIRNEHGSAILITLLIIGLVSLLGMMAINSSVSETELSFNQLHSDEAFYIAQSGTRRAYTELVADYTWRSGFTDETMGDGAYSVSVIDSTSDSTLSDTVILRCTGEVDGSRSIVELWTSPRIINPFGFAMFAEAGIVFDKETCTDSFDSDSGTYATTRLDSLGDVGTNGTVSASKDVNFGGGIQVATDGGITLGPFCTINGDTTSTADSVELDIIPPEEFTWAETNSVAGTGMVGTNYTYDPLTKDLTMGLSGTLVLTSGVYFFDDITCGSDSRIELAPSAQVTIYTTGDIVMNQNSVFNSAGSASQLQVYSSGSTLQFDQGNLFQGAFYGPSAHIQYDQTTQVYGSLVGGTIKIDQGACFHYDRSLAKIERKIYDDMVMVAVREL